MSKPTKWYVCPAKTQISLGIRPVWSGSSLSAWRHLGSLATHWAHSEDSDQTGRMLGAQPRCWFCYEVAQVFSLTCKCFPETHQKQKRQIFGFNSHSFFRLWYFSSSVNSFFKRACAAVQLGLDVWFLVGPFVYFHTLCVRTAKALARLRGCAGSPEPSLVAFVVSTIISWAGFNYV